MPGVFLTEQEFVSDERGFFSRFHCVREFADVGLESNWVQGNNSLSLVEGTIRGLHFQVEPNAEAKLVRCVRGSIWDVAVDVRPDSPTFGKWCAETLSAENRRSLYIPRGFAHGFQTLDDDTEVVYLVSNFYAPRSERSLNWADPDVSIQWPLPPTVLSNKDRRAPGLLALRSAL